MIILAFVDVYLQPPLSILNVARKNNVIMRRKLVLHYTISSIYRHSFLNPNVRKCNLLTYQTLLNTLLVTLNSVAKLFNFYKLQEKSGIVFKVVKYLTGL